jgi:tetratricopeptide (TPR) repeat protein
MSSLPSDSTALHGRFCIEAELARGGMGAVYRAVDRSTGKRVALKRLLAGGGPKVGALFEREFYVLSSLSHPRIIEVYEYGVDAEGPFYTMELLEGSDLREVAPVDVVTACRYLRDVASSLALLHVRRLLHRDISPRNVRTLPDGGCKLLDFGALTSFGTPPDFVGTAPAIPPEALFGQGMDQRADIFSLGALAFFVLTRRHGYPAKNFADLPDVWKQKPPPPSAFAPDVPQELDQLVLSMLSVDLLARPRSAAEVIERLNVIGGLEPDQDKRAVQAYFVGAALVEREHEVARIKRRIERAMSGRGNSVFVEGSAGCGKTRLLAESVRLAQLSGMTALQVDAALQNEEAFSTVQALIGRLARFSPKLAAAIFPDPKALPRNLSALEAAFAEISEKTPLMLVVDNVERADAESTALLLALSRGCKTRRLLVLTSAGHRSSGNASIALRALRDAGTSVRLRELTEGGVHSLLTSAFGDIPHVKRTGTRLFEVTSGNPDHCMTVMQGWVTSGVAGYESGSWVLPLELPKDALPRVGRATTERLLRCSPPARALAEVLGLLETPAPLELCAAMGGADADRRQVLAGVSELVEAEILTTTPEGYCFRQESVRRALVAELGSERTSELHAKIAELLLEAGASNLRTRFAIGFHFIRGGHETRGADIVAEAGRAVVLTPRDLKRTVGPAVPALEAALEVYRRESRSSLKLLNLLLPMVFASYECSRDLAERHGDETLEILSRLLGVAPPDAGQRPADLNELMAALASAPVLEPGHESESDKPDVVTLVRWLIRAAITLTAVASAAIEPDKETRYAAFLAPFQWFGPEHPAAIAHDYCQLLVLMTRDRMAHAHQVASDLLARLDRIPVEALGLERMRIGAVISLGVLEAQMDDDRALARIAELEKIAPFYASAVANQLKFLFYGFRGQIELAESYREKVEAHAIQQGTAWQVEIWSTCTSSAVYGNNRDTTNHRRIVEQLERLRRDAPSLEPYFRRAVCAQHSLRGDAARALELLLELDETPRVRTGWAAVQGMFTRAYNELGKFDEAVKVGEAALEHAAEDRDFVAMNLSLWLELAIAYAGSGAFERAWQLTDDLLVRHAQNQNPMTLGCIARTAARIALLEGDTPRFEQHLAEMDHWFRSTKNPALIAQCDKLRNTAERGEWNGWSEARPGVGFAVTSAMTLAQSVLAQCRGAEERKQRALMLVADKAGVDQAWLFVPSRDSAPVLEAQLGVGDVPGDLLEQVREHFARHLDESAETDRGELNASGTFALAAPASRYQVFSLLVNRGAEMLMVGAMALPANPERRAVSYRLLTDLGQQLFEAGDIGTFRLVG